MKLGFMCASRCLSHLPHYSSLLRHDSCSISSTLLLLISFFSSLFSPLPFRHRQPPCEKRPPRAATENPLRLRHVVAVGRETATDFRHGAAMAEI